MNYELSVAMPDTTVTYHRDGYGPGRPAVNVKVRQTDDFWPLELHLGDSGDDALVDRAFEIVQERFWTDAADKAADLGLGPIEQEGRSGGWLVLTDGRDPEAMEDDHVCQCGHWQSEHYEADEMTPLAGCEGCPDATYHHTFEIDPEMDTLPEIASRGGDPTMWPRHAWLAAYRQLSGWCAAEVAAAPARVAALAQQLAMDELGAEPATRMFATFPGRRYNGRTVPA